MTHSAHRYGTVENLSNDYTFYARTSRYVNREGCGPNLRKILEILMSADPVNLGSSHAGKSYLAGLDMEEYAKKLDTSYGIACAFDTKEKLKSVLAKLKEADIGISIVSGGLIDDITEIAGEIGITPHTTLLSLGIHGRTQKLPEDKVLEITTMCGHGMVSSNLARKVIAKVREGRLTPREGALVLAQPCPCGIFNTVRCAALLEECR